MKGNAVYGLARYGFAVYGYPLTFITTTPAQIIDPSAGGGHRKRIRGPKAQEIVNGPEGRSKYDGIEDLLKKQFLPEERVIPLKEVRQVTSPPEPLRIYEPRKQNKFTLGDNEEIRLKLEALKYQLTEIREEYEEDDAISMLLLLT